MLIENEKVKDTIILWLITCGLLFAGEILCPPNANAQSKAGFDLGTLPLLTEVRTRSISAENPTGEKGKGAMAIPDPADPNPPAAASCAYKLGQGWKVRPFLRVKAGASATLMDVDGPGVIQHIWMVEGLNSRHVLRFYWDGEESPSIEVPVPDFFAVGHGMMGRVNSAVVAVNAANAMNSYWPMPFRKHAKITFTNEHPTEDLILLAYQITYAETKIPEEAGYFHAQWRRGDTGKENPYVILDGVKGKGRYVGTFLAWTQKTDRDWFGEGEIKFYLDGDKKFPTICGTGTEDYFLSSYGFPEVFTTAYAGCTLPAKYTDELPQYWSLYRWHILDPICYDNDLRVTIQALGAKQLGGGKWEYKLTTDDITSVAYWYQSEPHAPFPALLPWEERARWTKQLQIGALEGEKIRIIETTGGIAERQIDSKLGWSKGAQLWWRNGRPGDKLTLALPIPKAGTYNLDVNLTKASDYGIVQFYLNDKKLSGPIDLYNASVVTEKITLDTGKLAAGEHRFAVEITGINGLAKKGYMVGLDYVFPKLVE